MSHKSSLFLAAFLVGCFAPPAPTPDYQFQVRPENTDECYEERRYTIVYLKWYTSENGELKAENATKVVDTRRCCEGYMMDMDLRKCVRDEEYVVCGNVSCKAPSNAECITFEKCGNEIELFMNEGSLVSECYEEGFISLLSCSGVCVQDPCQTAACPALDESKVSCFISGCDCQAKWIRLKDKAEVDCQTGTVVHY